MEYETFLDRDSELTRRPVLEKAGARNMTPAEIASATIMQAKSIASATIQGLNPARAGIAEARREAEKAALEAFAMMPAVPLDFALLDRRIAAARGKSAKAYQAAVATRDQALEGIAARRAELQADLDQLTRTIPELYRTDRAATAHALDRQLVLKSELAYQDEERAAAEVTFYRTVLPLASALAAEVEAIDLEFTDQIKAINGHIATARQALSIHQGLAAGAVSDITEKARQSTIRLQEAHQATDQAHQASIGAIKPLAG